MDMPCKDKIYYGDKYVTIYHGDCREILPQLPQVDLVLTDPPYGVGVKYGELYNDNKADYWEWLLPIIKLLRDRGEIVILTHKVSALKFITDWDWVGVWEKPKSFASRLGNSCIVPHWEPIFMWGIHSIGTKGRHCFDVFRANPSREGVGQQGLFGRESWKVNLPNNRHITPKPAKLITELIQAFAPEGGVILDPFLGSGTTAYCAKKLNRYCIGIEIEEKYCEITANRCRQEVMELRV